MQRRDGLIALALLAAASVACSGSKRQPASSARSSLAATVGTPIAAGTPSTAALIGVQQLGGWSAAPAARVDFGAARCDGQPLLLEAGTAAEAAFSKGDGGPWSIERIGRAREGGATAFARLGDLLRRCHRLTTPAPTGGSIAWTPAPLAFPRLADDSLAERLTALDAPRPLAADLVFFRHGDTIALVAQVASPPGPDTATTRTLVQQAEAKLLHFVP